jgi:beta-glucosidase
LKAPQTKVSPKHFLAGFQRVHLAAGASAKVTIPIEARAMSEVDVDGVRAVMPGDYTLWMGGGQPGTGAAGAVANFKVTGSKPLPQ